MFGVVKVNICFIRFVVIIHYLYIYFILCLLGMMLIFAFSSSNLRFMGRTPLRVLQYIKVKNAFSDITCSLSSISKSLFARMCMKGPM